MIILDKGVRRNFNQVKGEIIRTIKIRERQKNILTKTTKFWKIRTSSQGRIQDFYSRMCIFSWGKTYFKNASKIAYKYFLLFYEFEILGRGGGGFYPPKPP